MYSLFRPLLFRIEPERTHNLTIQFLRLVGAIPMIRGYVRRVYIPNEQDRIKVFGLTFPNPIGLAAGYDKDGLALRGLACLGFGHIEVGTVTLKPQVGNPQPRVFRLLEDLALINRMGFPSRGAHFLARRLQVKRPSGLILGVNIGKNQETSLDKAPQDYINLLRIFAPLADYLAVNVSSPNTVGLRRLQARDSLFRLLENLRQERERQVRMLDRPLPLLVKLSPDLTEPELVDALEVIVETGMDGVIVTNTTVHRGRLRSPLAGETGGLSGKPLRELSTDIIKKTSNITSGALPIVGVGGVMSAEDAQEKFDAGASLIQVYTGLIYRGPSFVREILKGLGKLKVED